MVNKIKPEPQVGQIYEKNDKRYRRPDGSGCLGKVASVYESPSGRCYVIMEVLNAVRRGPKTTNVNVERLGTNANSGWRLRRDLIVAIDLATSQASFGL